MSVEIDVLGVTQAPLLLPPMCAICFCPPGRSFVVRAYRFFHCSACDYTFIDPRAGKPFSSAQMFNDQYFHDGGAGYLNYFDEGELLEAHGRRYGKLLTGLGAHSVLDVGTAAGFILRGMQQSGCTGIGIEPNASMVRFAARELGMNVCESTLEMFEHNQAFDAVTLFQVVDHLEDPRQALERIRELTRPGSWCLVEFGNQASLTARLLGKHWHEYAPPSVRRVFSLYALERLFADYGFALHATGHPKKYLRADHALSLLQHTSPRWARNAIAGLAQILPAHTRLRYFGDDVMWALFRRDERMSTDFNQRAREQRHCER